MGGASGMGDYRNTYRLLVGNPDGRKPVRRPICRWVDDIMMYLGERG
jgi:hypothetical protein